MNARLLDLVNQIASLAPGRALAVTAPGQTPPRGAAVTLGQAIDAVMRAKSQANLRPCSLTSLRQYLAIFARGREEKPLQEFTVELIEEWFAGRNEKPAGRAANAGRLASMFSFAVRRQWIDHNPIKLLEPIRLDRKPPFVLTPIQAALLLDWARRRKPHQCAFYSLAMFAGIRPDELTRITWDCVKFEGDRATVTIDAAASKVRRRRLVELEPVAAQWLKVGKDAGGKLPVTVMTRCRFIGQACKVLGFDAWPKDCLRHTAASYLLAFHRDPGKVCIGLGNSQGILMRHYVGLVSPAECAEFWAFNPDSPRPVKPKPEIVRPELSAQVIPDGSEITIDPNASRFARAEAALRLEPRFRELGRERQRVGAYTGGVTGKRLGGERIDTIGQLGALAGCSRQTLQYVRGIVRHGDPDILDKLRAGKLSISSQYQQLLPLIRQSEKQTAPSSAV